ncbi:MAG: hypothetical protein MK160_06940 [Rhodobacteraceae bacterium]|nr:hypothetical protein [Paracoccaceae bacterium]
MYARGSTSGFSGVDLAASVLSLMWLGGSTAFFATSPDPVNGYKPVLIGVAIVLPALMIWVGSVTLRSLRALKAETDRLKASMNALRKVHVAQLRSMDGNSPTEITRKLEEISAAQRKTETTLAMFTSTRVALQPGDASQGPRPSKPEPAAPDASDQPALALGTPAEELDPPLPKEDLIRALNFPETAEDEAGFAALRRALRDRPTAQLVQASQDVLTLLSQDGIYMDDLRPDMARPEVWRQFGQGERGRAIAALGGIRDRSSLALTAGRMKSDPIFRDAAHHFLRLFDKHFADFESDATDSDISDMANTRTARAFMLIGRVTGTFS